jgi:hypothetical protein
MRLGAMALFAGGLLQVPATAFDPDLYDPRALFNPAETPVHAIFWIAYLMITLGLPGAYFIHADKMGWLGTVGFLLALAGSAMTMSVSLLDGFYIHAGVARNRRNFLSGLRNVRDCDGSGSGDPGLGRLAPGGGQPSYACSLCSAGRPHTYHHRLVAPGDCFHCD